MSRGVHRGVYSSLFDDPDYQRLSPRARHVLLTVRQSRECGPAGIFIFYPEVTARQTGYSVRQVEAAIVELERSRWVVREATVLWIRNALRYDPTMALANPRHRRAVERAIATLPHLKIVVSFCEQYGIAMPFDSHSIAEPTLVPPSTEYRGTSPSTEVLLREPTTSNSHPITFRVAPTILDALDRSGRLGAVPRLRSPEFWKAQIQANGSVDLPAEILRAEAWLCANPSRAPRKDLSRFLNNWLCRAREAL